jgi:LytTr DNA-binding domain
MHAGLLLDPLKRLSDSSARPGLRSLGPALLMGFGYWMAFLLVLEPGNLLEMARSGAPIPWDQEALRILGASLLGASASPALLVLIRRFPVEGAARWRNAAIHLAACILLAFGLIVVSCLLAGWWLAGEHRPLAQAIPEELVANELLVAFCLAVSVAGGHAIRFRRRLNRPPAAGPAWLEAVTVKTRGRLEIVGLAEIDWIETQGNYLALHAGAATHLIRETSQRFEAKLDPARFIRIHRRTLVAADRVKGLTSLGGGDAEVELRDGTVLRLSRGFRDRLRGLTGTRG